MEIKTKKIEVKVKEEEVECVEITRDELTDAMAEANAKVCVQLHKELGDVFDKDMADVFTEYAAKLFAQFITDIFGGLEQNKKE